jgi:hypothetical protein
MDLGLGQSLGRGHGFFPTGNPVRTTGLGALVEVTARVDGCLFQALFCSS